MGYPVKDTGQIKDPFELLTENYQAVNTEAFKQLIAEAHIPVSHGAKLLGMSRQKLYKPTAKITDENVKKRLLDCVKISSLACELFDTNKAKEWLLAPNHLFFDTSPFQMALGGKGKAVLDTLEEWLEEPA